jgi:hypothetical protein
VVFADADHGLIVAGGLQRLGGGAGPENYFWRWRRLAPGVVETTLDWLLKRVRVAK